MPRHLLPFLPLRHCLLLASLASLGACDNQAFELLAPLEPPALATLGVQTPVQNVHFRDRDGEAVLVLSRLDDQVSDEETEQEVDRVVLTATLYGRSNDAQTYKARWTIENETTCPGLDLDVGFYTDVSGASDLNNDGVAELTVASHSFCGGGVDPQDLHVELREGAASYVINGQSLIAPEGEDAFGGEREDGPTLKDAPPVLREHLEKVWNSVLKRPWSDAAPDADDDDPDQ